MYSFENTMYYLHRIGVLNIQESKAVLRTIPIEELPSVFNLGAFLLKKTVKYWEGRAIYEALLNKETAIRDANSENYILNTNKVTYPFFKIMLLHLGIATPQRKGDEQLVLGKLYQDILGLKETGLSQLPEKVNIFISYAHVDEPYKEELVKHFSGLMWNGRISSWNGRAILPGGDWDDEIKKKLEEARIVLFLISADFMASEYIRDVELEKAIERHNQGKIKIIPIILRKCDFKSLPISKYQALPKNAEPIEDWKNKDHAYYDVVEQIKKIL